MAIVGWGFGLPPEETIVTFGWGRGVAIFLPSEDRMFPGIADPDAEAGPHGRLLEVAADPLCDTGADQRSSEAVRSGDLVVTEEDSVPAGQPGRSTRQGSGARVVSIPPDKRKS